MPPLRRNENDVLRHATIVLLAAASLVAAAGADPYDSALAASGPARHVIVRTELVPSDGGFHWLDAAAGFGVAVVVLLVVGVVAGRRVHARPGSSAF